MGLIGSRRSTGAEEPEVSTGNPYRYPPRSGKSFPVALVKVRGLGGRSALRSASNALGIPLGYEQQSVVLI